MKTQLIKILLISFFVLLIAAFTNISVSAASYEFSPATASIPSACSFEVDVKVDTGTARSNAADIEIHFDPTQIYILDSNSSIPGVQVKNGDAYDSYVYNSADNATGIIRVAAGSIMSELTGRKTFIRIGFQAKPGATVANFNIYFTGANHTLDSNIADSVTNLDLLTNIIDGSYTFNETSCAPDRIAPIIIVRDPQGPGHDGLLTIEVDLTDEQSGVNVGTFQVVINGVVYTSSNAVVTYSGDKFHYQLQLDPNLMVNYSSPTMLLLTVRDFAGNLGSKIIYLNFPTPTPSPTPTTSPLPTVTITPRITITTIPTDTPQITELPETGPSPTPCPVYTDKTCIEIIDKELEKGNYYDTKTVDNISLTIGKINLMVPGLGLLALLSLLVNIPSFGSIIFTAIAIKKWQKRLLNFIGIITDKDNSKYLESIKVTLLDSQNLKLSETETDCLGRYFFDIKPGIYKLEIEGNYYQKAQYPISYSQEEKVLHQIISKNRRTSVIDRMKSSIRKVLTKDGFVFSIIALIISIFALVFSPGTITTVIFVINIVIMIITVGLKIFYNRKYD